MVTRHLLPSPPRAVGLVLLILVMVAGGAGAAEVPALSGRVVDRADLLSPAAERNLASRLEAFEASTGHQVAVLTLPSLGGEPIETYSMRVVEDWELGRAEADDGVLLLIVPDDRQMRLEVGYGLESELTDLASRRVLDHVIAPRFRQGDFEGGVAAGVEAVIAALEEGESGVERYAVAESSAPDLNDRMDGLFFLALCTLFAFQLLCSRGCAKVVYVLLALILVAVGYALFAVVGAVGAGVLFLVVLPLLSKVLCGVMSSGGSSGGGPLIGGFGGGGGFSGGGFSGGGGSFGGGGASSSW